MPNKGYIKLFRQIQDCWIWNTGKFDKRSAWIDLLMMANHKEVKLLFNGAFQMIKRGQFITSISNLANRWEWSKSTVYTFLNLLETDGMINKASDNKRTLITIINYSIYQGIENDEETPAEHESNTNRKQIETNNKLKNINKRKEISNDISKRKIFKPPTVDEVRAYCQERKNGIDPNAFCDFYESKDWMVGSNKMKDWKAAVRTWENKRKKETPKVEDNYSTNDKLAELERYYKQEAYD